MSKTIYYRLARALEIAQLIEDNGGEVTPELEEAFKITSENLAERAEEMVDIRANCDTLIAGSKKRIEAEETFIQQQLKTIALIDKGLKSGVELLGAGESKKMQAGPYALSLRKSSAVIITDAAKIPDEYRKPVVVPKTPEKGEPDKALLKKALESKILIEGAYIENRSNLTIK